MVALFHIAQAIAVHRFTLEESHPRGRGQRAWTYVRDNFSDFQWYEQKKLTNPTLTRSGEVSKKQSWDGCPDDLLITGPKSFAPRFLPRTKQAVEEYVTERYPQYDLTDRLSQVYNEICNQAYDAYKRWKSMSASHGVGFPKRSREIRSMRFPNKIGWKLDGPYLTVHGFGIFKLYDIERRPLPGIPDTLRLVVRHDNRLDVQFVMEVPDEPRKEKTDVVLGMDFNSLQVTFAVAHMNGAGEAVTEQIYYPKWYRESQNIIAALDNKIARLKRLRSRDKTILSKEQFEQKYPNFQTAEMTRLQQKRRCAFYKFTCQRKTWWRQIIAKLDADYNPEVIAIDDINMAQIVQSDREGRTTDRNKGLLDISIGLGKLYFRERFNTRYIDVPPAYTTRTCNKCGHVNEKIPTAQRVFVCSVCAHVDDRDVNAAKNVVDRAIGIYMMERKTHKSLVCGM